MLELPGVRLFVREVGSGPPVVLVHGGPGLPHEQLLPHGDRLAARFRLVYYDQRGCGHSGDPEPPEALTWRDHVADPGGVIRRRAGRPVGLLGFYWGALLAQFYAVRHPADLACLVLVSGTGARADGWREVYRAERARREAALRTPERLEALNASGLRERDRAAFDRARYRLWAEPELAEPGAVDRLTPVWMGERGELANALTLASLGDYDLRPDLARLRVPTLVVHGRHDARPLDRAAEVAAILPDARLVVLEESGHMPFAEEPERFFSVVEEFLRAHLEAGE